MQAFEPFVHQDEETIARLTDIAYRALLKQGLQRPFLEVELELWRDIRAAYRESADPVPSIAQVA
jgi:hypothetical protein